MRNFLFLSHLADAELERQKQKAYCLDECGRVLISFFSTFQMSNEKNIVFFCIICLIRVYFKLKNYRNSKTLIGWVEKSGLNLNENNPVLRASCPFLFNLSTILLLISLFIFINYIKIIIFLFIINYY